MRTGTPITAGLRRCATLAACVVMSGWWSVPLSYAAETPVPHPSPSNSTTYTLSPDQFSLTISPTRLVVGPADIAKTAKFQVVNRGQAAVSVAVQVRNFTGGADGSLDFRNDAPYAAANWMTVSPLNFTVAPGGTQVVTANIAVPPAPEPGDHQVALVFLVPAGKTSANIKINRGIGTPLYITVPGPTDDSATLSGLTAPGFVLRGPVDVSATVHDTGTVHRDFRGTTPARGQRCRSARRLPRLHRPARRDPRHQHRRGIRRCSASATRPCPSPTRTALSRRSPSRSSSSRSTCWAA